MFKMQRSRKVLLLVVIFVVGGLLTGVVETEGANHQDEVHHCASCCLNHHVATPTAQETFHPILPQDRSPLSELASLHPQPVVRLPERPPKHLA